MATFGVAVALLAAGWTPPASAQGRFLAKDDILLYGLGLRVEPATQTVPRDIATIVSTYLQAPQQPTGLPPFAPDAVVKGTLRGPGLQKPLELQIQPNSPFNIPPLTIAGTYTLENIRLESQGTVLLRGTPESARIDVIDKLLVTQVTARALTAAEIREKGIVFDSSNFQAYNFTAAFAIQDNPIKISFPVVLPSLQGAAEAGSTSIQLTGIRTPTLPSLKTLIPDTLKIATTIPNLSVTGFTLEVPSLAGQQLNVPPIPGVVVIPGDIGFLNQYFSVMLMVGNVAPAGSNLVVSNLSAEILLPAGNDKVANSLDDPLAMAQTTRGESPRVQPIAQAGADGLLGTADDIITLGPGESGNAEYLVEGRREGSHIVEMAITGTLMGLPVGPVPITGRAAGAVLVRNPAFTLTFTHPEVVNAGEAYTLDVTVTNTSASPANFVSLTLSPRDVSGATIVGDATKQVEMIAPSDSATVSFSLVSRLSGKVTAATLDAEENVSGQFRLKTSVGELGVPLSPDSLVLPKEASALPQSLRDAALGLLGKAWAVATAPAAALPKDVRRFSKQIVLDRAIEAAEAGFRVALHEPTPVSAAQLLMDFAGSNYARIATFYPDVTDQQFTRDNFLGFDELRRKSVRGDGFAAAVAALLAPELQAQGAAAFHQQIATAWGYRPGFLSILVSTTGSPSPWDVMLVDAQGRQVGGLDASGKVLKQIPYADALLFKNAGGETTGTLLLLASPDPGTYAVRLVRRAGVADTPVTISAVLPADAASGDLRHLVFEPVTAESRPAYEPAQGEPLGLTFEIAGSLPGSGNRLPATSSIIPDAPPTVLGVVQQADADVETCGESILFRAGRVVAVLFSEEVAAESIQNRAAADRITAFAPEANRAVGVALQPGRRIAFVALRDGVGPYVPRSLTVSDAADLRGHTLGTWTGAMEATVPDEGVVVSGRVLQGDGSVIPGANVRLHVPGCDGMVGLSSKYADADGRYQWDYVPRPIGAQITAVDMGNEESRAVRFTANRPGQRLNIDVVLLGRGTLQGRVFAADGKTPLAGSQLRVTSLVDHSQYGATTDAEGRYVVARVPVGSLYVEAVNVKARAEFRLTEYIPFAGATVSRNISLLPVGTSGPLVMKMSALTSHVMRADGATPAAGVPVIAYYANQSQPGVSCPPLAGGMESIVPAECAVGLAQTGEDGGFTLEGLPAGSYRINTFDQAALAQGEVRLVLAEGANSANILLSGGLGRVVGVVVDATGARVAGARVGGGLSLTTADANGEFVLPDVPVGHREIVAVSDTLGVTGRAAVDITHEGETVAVTIVLPAAGSVAGRVFRSDGATPAAGVPVFLFSYTGSQIAIAGQAATDAAGAYRIDSVLPGQYTVSAYSASLPDGGLAAVALNYNGQVARADIRFRGGAGGAVSGTVLNADGSAPLKARVGVSADRPLLAGGKVLVGFQFVQNFAIVDTGLDGRFRFNGLWVGDFTLRAVGQFSPDPITANGRIAAPGESVQQDLHLQDASRVAGVVYQPDGATPAGANVIVTYKSDAFRLVCESELRCVEVPQGIQSFPVATDAQGRFFINPVNAGPFTLTAEDPVSGKVARIRGMVRPGEQAEMSVRLLGVGSLTVRVVSSDAVTPIPGAKVEVQQTGYPGVAKTLYADANGVLMLSGGDALTEGSVVVRATDVRTGFSGRAAAEITQDGQSLAVTVHLFDASGRVAGTVYKADGTTPVPNAEVNISQGGTTIAYATTGADGTFSQEAVPLGAFVVDVFEAATSRIGSATGRIDLDKQRVVVNVTQLAIGQVDGTAMESGPLTPLAGWTAALQPVTPSGRRLPVLQGMTAADGSFSFPGVATGTFTLSVRKSGVVGSGSASGSIDREGQIVDVPVLVEIVRPLFGRVEGVVRNPDGSAAGNAQVLLNGGRAAVAAGDGTFAFDDVTMGRFEVSAKAQVTGSSGRAFGDLSADGEIAFVTIVLTGLSSVHGVVQYADGSAAAGVQIAFTGSPSSTCGGTCTKFTNADGSFAFSELPARLFTLTATDTVRNLRGSAGGTVNPGQDLDVRVVLQPSAALQGRVLFAAGKAAPSMTCEVILSNGQHLFVETDQDGRFAFSGVALAGYRLEISDPIGPGVARRTGTLVADVEFGDITLDESAPVVASLTPAASAAKVPQNQPIVVVFSEPIDPATVTASNFLLSGTGAPIAAVLNLSAGDTTVTLSPVSALDDETRYTLRVTGVKDRLGKVMAPDYVASFTTADVTPPSAVDVSPGQAASGVPIYATVRVKFSEPIDPVAWGAAPMSLTLGGSPVGGRFDYLFGNTVVAFTPAVPLAENAAYRVRLAAARDLAGNAQAQGLDYTFATTDGTAPQVTRLASLSGASVVENTAVRVRPEFTGALDVAVVDYYVNGSPVGSSRSAPFEFSVLAAPNLGAPGGALLMTAVATDTSGNRGLASPPLSVPITADQLPAISITAPAGGTSFRNGDRVTVTVSGTDDLGLTALAYRALTGRAQDAGTQQVTPPSASRTASFGFNVPTDAAAGSTIQIEASAIDTKGQSVSAATVSITVIDAVAPSVSLSGSASGDRVRPGQTVSVALRADDGGGLREVTFTAAGAASYAETRQVGSGATSLVTSFTFTVPNGAPTGGTITLDGTATDRDGNTGAAARIVLTVGDLVAPIVTVRTSTGSTVAVAGQALTILTQASDDGALASISLAADGAFTFSDTRQVSPPSNSASVTFNVTVPQGVQVGQIVTFTARATDLAGNVSQPATFAVTIVPATTVTMPSSIVGYAGDDTPIDVQLSAPAAAGGQLVTFTSSNTEVATVAASVTIPEGQTQASVMVSGVAGGTATIRAFIQGAERASTTAAIQGGVVSGRVYNEQLAPVAGVEITVANTRTATTDADGFFRVAGVGATEFGVKAYDPATQARGYATAKLGKAGGYAKDVNVVLIAAGLVTGTVFRADGQTPAGAGVQVDIALKSSSWQSLGTTFTDADSRFEFPLVTLGEYVLTAAATDGSRGRSALTVSAGAAAVDVAISFLGTGTVTGTVRDGSGAAVPNATLRFTASSVFGSAPVVDTSAGLDGTFRFEKVLIGSFSITARDPVSTQAGVASGTIAQDGQVVSRDVTVGSFGSVSGTVYRPDGTTTVPNAEVTTSGLRTFTDANGQYAFPVVPLGARTIDVSEAATRGQGRASVTLSANGEHQVVDIQLQPQGTLIVTVQDTGGVVPGASVAVTSSANGFSDSVNGTTGTDGRVILEHMLAGAFTVRASLGARVGAASGTLLAGATEPVTVELLPTASIAGVVYSPDGQTPATGTIRLNSGTPVPIGAGGSYRFDGVPLGHHSLYGYDSAGRKRAYAQSVELFSAGQVLVCDLRFIGLGTVGGRVTYSGSAAPGLNVQLRSPVQEYGGFFSAVTDGGGFYQVSNVPVGPFTVSVADSSRGLRGEASGAIAADGQTVTADVALLNNAITLPVNRYDANGFTYDIQSDGAVKKGFQAFLSEGAFKLDVIGDSSITRIVAGGVATSEQGGQQIVVRQDGVAGLNVERKVYVPLDGYFARYLEVLTNPTAAPISVGLRVSSQLGYLSGSSPSTPGVIATSSGDTSLDTTGANGDRWIVLDDYDYDPFTSGYFPPATALAFGGPAAAIQPGIASYDRATGRLQYQWDNVTVPAGGQVAVMHFGLQQVSRAAAQASAERLLQLPPEALDGLSAVELASVRNFAVPADGVSGLVPLPSVRASISGRVLEGDGAAAVAGATVTFKSAHPLFPRTLTATSSATGAFTFTGAATLGQYGGVPVPADAFTLTAKHPLTRVTSPVQAGSFAAGLTTTTADVRFSNAAILSGSVRLHGAPVLSGTVALLSGTYQVASVSIDTIGVFRFGGVEAGTYTLTASIPHAQGTGLTGTTTVTAVAGSAQIVDIPVEPTGNIHGVVSAGTGAGAANVLVELLKSGFTRSTRTDSAGAFALPDVPVGTYTLQATEPASTIKTTAAVTVADGSDLTQNLALIGVGTVQGTVTKTGGVLAGAGHTVVLTPTAAGATTYQTTTDAASGYRFTGVPQGAFKVVARNDAQYLYGEAAGAVSTAGETVTVDVTMLEAVTLPVTLYDANGFTFDIQANARVAKGTNNAFNGYGSYGAGVLSTLTGGSTVNQFTGAARGVQSEQNRQIAITQDDVGGVSVTRKVYVPTNGYFARYLELLTNKGTAPVTFDLELYHATGSSSTRAAVRQTSSGDLVFDTSLPTNRDRWVVMDDGSEADPFVTTAQQPPTAFVFDGPGAAKRASVALYTSGYPSFECAWQQITLEPGQTVAYLHFVVQQTSRAAAQASAERLVQLPPEALAGLNAEERLLIRNFAVPADGSSPLAALPAMNGRVSGRVLTDTGVAMASVAVTLKSTLPYFGRQYSMTTPTAGTFSLPTGTSTLFPVAPFTLTAAIAATGAGGAATGDFGAGQSTATQDVTVGSLSSISGTVRHNDGTTWSGMTVKLTGGGLPTAGSAPTTTTGAAFTYANLPAASYTLTVTPSSTACGSLSWTTPVTVVAGQQTSLDTAPADTGRVTGVLYSPGGLPVASTTVYISGAPNYNGTSCSVSTAANGTFTFLDVLPGAYSLYNTRNGAKAAVDITAAGGQVTSQNLTQRSAGSVVVRVTDGSGNPVSGSSVSFRHDGTSGSYYTAGPTDAAGQLTITSVPAGSFTVRATNPGNTSFMDQKSGSLSTEGETVTADLVVGGSGGTITGTVTRPVSGALVPSANVQVYMADGTTRIASVSTNASGIYAATTIPSGVSLIVRALDPGGYSWPKNVTGVTVPTPGATTTVNIALLAQATARITVLKADGTPLANARITRKYPPVSPTYGGFYSAGYTNASGQLDVTGMLEGTNTIRIYDPSTGYALAERTIVIQPTDQDLVLPVNVQLGVAISGTVTGRVFGSDGVTPISGASVRIYAAANTDSSLQSATSGADGGYSFTGVTQSEGGFIVEATASSVSRTAAGSFTGAGQTAVINVTVPVTAVRIVGRIYSADGTTPLAGRKYLVLYDPIGKSYYGSVNTALDGTYQLLSTLPSTMTQFMLRATNTTPAAEVFSTAIAVTGSGDYAMNIAMPLYCATVRGKVTAADGVTSVLDYTDVYLYDSDGTTVLTSSSTAADGSYQFTDATTRTGGFTLKVVFDSGTPYSRTIPGTMAGASSPMTMDVVMPLSVVRGRMLSASGTPVIPQNIFVEGSDRLTRYPIQVGLAGWLVLGTPPGEFHVTGQWSMDGVTVTATGTMVDIATPVELDVVLPGLGTVSATVRDLSGNPVQSWTWLQSNGLTYRRDSVTNASGVVSYSNVPEGPVMVQARPGTQTAVWAVGAANAVANQVVTVNLQLPQTGSVSGHAYQANGATPLVGSRVRWTSFNQAGPGGNAFGYADTDANGAFSFPVVPVGPVYLWIETAVAWATGTVAAGANATVDLVEGTSFPEGRLDGADGFRYGINGDGNAYDGGTISGAYRPLSTSSPSNQLLANNTGFSGNRTQGVEMERRQIVVGPAMTSSFVVTRKIYVPPAGGFARYLEIVHNPTTLPLPLTLRVSTYLAASSGFNVVATPAGTGNRYFVVDDSIGHLPTMAAVGVVVGGTGSVPVPVWEFQPKASTSVSSIIWDTTVPPGGDVMFLHYFIQAPPDAAALAVARAEALSNLTDPDALTGLTDYERAHIVNFNVPPAPGVPSPSAAALPAAESEGMAALRLGLAADVPRRVASGIWNVEFSR